MNSLLLTAHDYRTPRKANMHFIADQLRLRGTMRFFSLRYSNLSRWKGDARSVLDRQANRVEVVDGVECYLWKTWVHPFDLHRVGLSGLEAPFFDWYVRSAPPILLEWMRAADVIFFESGSAVLFVTLAGRCNPRARKIYIASDDLETIRVATRVREEFDRVAASMTALCLPGPGLALNMPSTSNKYFVPHGLDPSIAEHADPSPYAAGRHAVSVGSMLFDRTFFESAASAFPDVTFHVIGSGQPASGYPSNVRVYGEMPHKETLRYIKHADLGVAPYRGDGVSTYLADTSMKLMQYAFFGLPAVCPAVVVGGHAGRFGYQPGSKSSVIDAVGRALAAGRCTPRRFPDWSAVTDRLLEPERYPDARLVLSE
jgi:2-beta-glucuronyltransferase